MRLTAPKVLAARIVCVCGLGLALFGLGVLVRDMLVNGRGRLGRSDGSELKGSYVRLWENDGSVARYLELGWNGSMGLWTAAVQGEAVPFDWFGGDGPDTQAPLKVEHNPPSRVPRSVSGEAATAIIRRAEAALSRTPSGTAVHVPPFGIRIDVVIHRQVKACSFSGRIDDLPEPLSELREELWSAWQTGSPTPPSPRNANAPR
jgi:hypothetical protein